jgi:hypothetical protein
LNRNAAVFESAPIEKLAAKSTIEIAQTLSENKSRWRLHKILLVVLAIIFVFGIFVSASAAGSIANSAVILMIAGACIAWSAAALHSRQSLTVSLEYNLSGKELEPFNQLTRAFKVLGSCERVWQIPSEMSQADWKRNAGASKTVERRPTSLSTDQPALIKSNIEFLRLALANENLYFTPDAVLIIAGKSVAALRYDEVEIVCRRTKFIEDRSPPSDAQVVGESWLYVNKDGSPDRRFGNNRKLPICLYAELDLKSSSGLNERIHCSRLDSSENFVACMNAMRGANVVAPDNYSNDTEPPHPASEPVKIPAGTNLSAAYANESFLQRGIP